MIGILHDLFPGIFSLFVQDASVAYVRLFLIVFGFVLAYLGFKRTLEPLIMVPMGIGMIAINAGVLFMKGGGIGNIFLDPLVERPDQLVSIMQVNFLQPIYNFTFSNGLIACIIFFGIGSMSDIGFVLARPWASIVVAIFAELGSFITLVIGYKLGLPIGEAAAVGIIGGADGPMVLFTSLMLAPKLFVPISIIAYLYLSLTYAGYPYLIKLFIPRKYRGIPVEIKHVDVPKKQKFIFTVVMCGVLCILLPVAAPLIMSFFLGVAIREAEIEQYKALLDNTLLYASTLFLGLLLGILCDARTIMDPKVGLLILLGILSLAFSAIGGILGGWIVYWFTRGNFNPTIGIAGVSCVPTTAKLAQYASREANPGVMILPIALGANICGVIVTAIATGVFISTVNLVK
ncbi:sodium ion-translocating decarboxylase, beta subunit [Thermosinus carboxydivorans Nor1]|uniref:Carboxybiotin decarboxylase n=1 Tax=Thermosinus carboxydivorans Nor1 TaxID=401526 RepID=A1HNR6_9FIRM|nr:Na+-transporting malonate decarboxylase, carboxybiotin decarboxylase subunit [Thermosinus carboxydivorans]EAX48419.1 sodium ion-translocating decarboxylase, beta subunit [Thermosinus carboxydivorans Nor1]